MIDQLMLEVAMPMSTRPMPDGTNYSNTKAANLSMKEATYLEFLMILKTDKCKDKARTTN
jgi:hypothetical protein